MTRFIAILAFSLVFVGCQKSAVQASQTEGSEEETIIEELASSVVEESVANDTALVSSAAIAEEAAVVDGILINSDVINQVAEYIRAKIASGDVEWMASSAGSSRLAPVAANRLQSIIQRGQFPQFMQQRRGNVSQRFGAKMNRRGIRPHKFGRNGFGQDRPLKQRPFHVSQSINRGEEGCMNEAAIEALAVSADADANSTLSTTELAVFRTSLQAKAQECKAVNDSERQARRALLQSQRQTAHLNPQRRFNASSQIQARMFSKVRHTMMTVHAVLQDKVEATELEAFMTSLREEVRAKMEARRAEMQADLAAGIL